MSIYYYVLKQSSNEYVYLGTGSYFDCHEDLVDILTTCKRNSVSVQDVQEETMRLYDDYSGEKPLSDKVLKQSWYYKKFIPAIYNWFDSSCILLSDYELNNYAKNLLVKNGKLNSEDIKDETVIAIKDYISQCLKEVGSICEEDNDVDSIVDKGIPFSAALNELVNGSVIYRKSVLPEIDFKMEDNQLYWYYADDEKQEKHYLNVIGIDALFANDWLIKGEQ